MPESEILDNSSREQEFGSSLRLQASLLDEPCPIGISLIAKYKQYETSIIFDWNCLLIAFFKYFQRVRIQNSWTSTSRNFD